MGNPLISISVPVYNAEKYLRQCLDSLVNQTLKDIEIVIVNDGSTDSSEAICREYAEKDSRIALICKENGGLASARLAALNASKGQYFCACDSDDWAEPNMYEKLYQKAVESNADIVMSDYWSEYPNKKVECHYEYDIKTRQDLLDDALNGKLPCMVWNKIFKRDLFEKFSISWEPGINLGEDFLLMLKMLQHPVKIEYVKIPLYHYRREFGGSSYTNNISMDTFKQSLYIRHWAMNHIDCNKYENAIFRLWVSLAFTGLRVESGMTSEYYKKTIMTNIPYHGFFIYSCHKMKGTLIFFTKLFGYSFGRSIFRLMYKSLYK